MARRLAELTRQLVAEPATSGGTEEPGAPDEPVESVEPFEPQGWWQEHTRPAPGRQPRPETMPGAPDRVADRAAREQAPAADPAPDSAADGDGGRHASRRPRALADAIEDLVPAPLRGAAWLSPGQFGVVALVVLLGLGGLLWWALRGSPPTAVPVASAPLLGSASGVAAASDADGGGDAVGAEPAAAAPSASTAPTSGATGTGQVVVDVAGRVRRPGIVVLPGGSRVADALKRAGGARPGVDLTSLNLARVLVDGEQILVGVAATPTAPDPGAVTGGLESGDAASPTTTAPVDLNTATEADLDALPDVGPVTAGAILTWRSEHGRFTSVSELLEVDGIGDATLAKLTPLVTVSGG